MNIAICDDDIQFTKKMHRFLDDYFKKEHIKDFKIYVFHRGEDAISSGIIFDIAFLDMEMDTVSGSQTGYELSQKNPKLIFFIITAYDHYIDEAFRVHAFRYLSKPLDFLRLTSNINDALYLYKHRVSTVVIETKSETHKIDTDSIIMIEVQNRKVHIITKNGTYISIHPLKYWLKELENLPFFQTHKSFVVNFLHVASFSDNLVKMDDGSSAYLTQRKYYDFKKSFMTYAAKTI